MIYAKLTEELKSAPKTDNPEYTIFLRNLVMSYELNDLYEYFVPIIEDPDIDKDIRFSAYYSCSIYFRRNNKFEEMITAKTKAIIVNSPNNPSGVVYSEETIKKLAEVLTAKSKEYNHPIFLISDEPYREIAYGVDVPYLPKYYDNTIVCYSYSKSFSLPGERIGYIVVPDEVADFGKVYGAIAGAARVLTHVNAPSLFQLVIARCAGKESDMSTYEKNGKLLYNGLIEAGFKCVKPQGAFYLFPQSLEPDDYAFCKRAQKYDLLLVPGSDFGCPGHFRASYCIKTETIEKSLPLFKKLAEEYKK